MPPENYDDSFFLDIHKNYPKAFLIAELSGKVVGYIMCRAEIGFSELRKLRLGRKGHVVSLAVIPDYRGQGVATALLSEALKNIASYNVDEIYLEVRVSNKPAIDLYQSLNFKTIRTIKGYYRDGEDAHVMSRQIE